jgi:hypothetical protein
MSGETKFLTLPTIHLNGTSASSLASSLETAVIKLRDAQRALDETSPNARDYYVQGVDVFEKARNEHIERQKKLTSVIDELTEIWSHVMDQGRL